MTDNEREKTEQERIYRCNNCKYCIRLCERYANGSIYCECKKFAFENIDPTLLMSCKYYKSNKKNINN